jgi:predicted esterase
MRFFIRRIEALTGGVFAIAMIWLVLDLTVDDIQGAATYDKHVGLFLFTGQVTYKIDADVDKEHDFVVRTLKDAKTTHNIKVVEHFTAGYSSRNGAGDFIRTDGSLPIIRLTD